MKEYIEREKVEKVIEKNREAAWDDTRKAVVGWIDADISDIPNADVRSLKYAKWKNGCCTNCEVNIANKLDNWTDVQNFAYCPICGAKMEDHGEPEYLIKVHGIMSIKAKNLDEALDIAWEKIPDDLTEISSIELEGVEKEEC